MKKYLVDVYVPAIGIHYDVYLPTRKQVGEAMQLLIKMVESLSSGSYKGTANSTLIKAHNGIPLNLNDTVYDAGIRNSTKLILV